MTADGGAGAGTAPRDRAGEVIYRISHDLQAPVRALRALPEWIEEDLRAAGIPVPDDVAGHLGMMQVQSRRLQSMILDLLTFSRVGRPQPPFDGDWQALAQGVLAECKDAAEGHQVTLDLPSLPAAIGGEDAGHLVAALLTNAIKHHHRGRGSIRVHVARDGAGVRFSVTDDGPGIPPEKVETAKAIMETLRARDEVEGSGMGLAIAERICACHGGTLTLAPAPGGGCHAEARLPAPDHAGPGRAVG